MIPSTFINVFVVQKQKIDYSGKICFSVSYNWLLAIGMCACCKNIQKLVGGTHTHAKNLNHHITKPALLYILITVSACNKYGWLLVVI